MVFEQFKHQLPDSDSVETSEWMESLEEIVERSGQKRAQFLLYRLLKRARQMNVGLPQTVQSRYINTISPEQEAAFPGDEAMERRIRRLIRWNAVAMVVRANRAHEGIGGHLSTYASAASLIEVGFNHFFRGPDHAGGGDHVYFQGHAAPGIYARAFLEGRLTEAHLENFRQETGGEGLSSYPHPRLMPDFWEHPTVSMGLGPLNAMYHARFNRYLHARGIADTSGSRVWAFLGDGECDEPEALGALTLAKREGLDNLTFVVNCNLQRLDGPVRGNGKIIQELESVFRGAGWNVIKVVWGREWDELLARDVNGVLINRMMDTLDGDYQLYSTESGAFIREHFFGPEPELQSLVADYSDAQLKKLRRGGHDYRKLYSAYKAASETEGVPTVILAKTVKGWTLGAGSAGRNVTHQKKKLEEQELKLFRDLLQLPIPDSKMGDVPYYHPGAKSEEIEYMLERRNVLGGGMPNRRAPRKSLPAPEEKVFTEFQGGTGEGVEVSTTMAFVRMLRSLLKQKELGPRIVPIIPDEARTFGMEPLFAEFGIYAAKGQKYTPVDANYLLKYREAEDGQILEEGITEAGSMASFTAAGTSYAHRGAPMIPFFTFYSMFGFQRIMDLIWAAADARARGFLMGATAGRTTLQGEGLQHDDGHSHVMASLVPSVIAYDPAFAYEVATIVKDGLRRMNELNEDLIYYITIYNENYVMPSMPEGAEEGILRGLYRLMKSPPKMKHRARIMGSGPLLNEGIRARDILAADFGVGAEVWSATSYTELRRDALECERWNVLHPNKERRVPYVEAILADDDAPIVATSDNVKTLPELISRWVPAEFRPLGTDGFGRSDNRKRLRRFFEIDAEHIVVTVLSSLARRGDMKPSVVTNAMKTFGINPDIGDPAAAELSDAGVPESGSANGAAGGAPKAAPRSHGAKT
jgi:pyruvate dehydrogenase E1 component